MGEGWLVRRDKMIDTIKTFLCFEGEEIELKTEAELDKETDDEMNAVVSMIKQADEQGLLVEVIMSAMNDNSNYTIPQKCGFALSEWDC